MKRKKAALKTNAGCMVQGLSLGLRLLNEVVSIPGRDFRRDQMKAFLAAALAIGFAAQTGKAFAYACNNITTSIHPAISSTRPHVATSARSARRNAVTAALAFQSITVARHRGTCSSHGGVAYWD